MNERKIIESIAEKYPIKEGSNPLEMTPIQQRGVNVAGNLLIHAHRKGKRRRGRWV